MNVLNIVFLSLFLLTLTAYIVFYCLKFNLVQKILSCFIMPFAGAYGVSELVKYLPDSFHILFLLILVFAALSVSQLLFIFEQHKSCRITGRLLYALSMCFWIELYYTTFYFYHIPAVVNVIAVILYGTAFILLCVFLGRQPSLTYIWTIALGFICVLFHYCALITVCLDFKVYSFFLITGSTLFLVLQIFYVLSINKYHFKNEIFIRTITLTLSQIFILISAILMIR